MAIRHYIILWACLLLSTVAAAQDYRNNPRINVLDTINNRATEVPIRPSMTDSLERAAEIRADQFYDSLQSKSHRRKFVRLIHDMVIIHRKYDTTATGRYIDEAELMKKYAGRTIRHIEIDRRQVFENGRSWLQKSANSVHRITRARTIRRDLLFRSGDKLDPEEMVRNSQLIRSRKYIYDVAFEIEPDPYDSTIVDINIVTRDSWTIGVNMEFFDGRETTFDLYDANFLGTGDRLSVRTNFNWDLSKYGGQVIDYRVPNLFGSFFNAQIKAGKNFDTNYLEFDIKKDFILPNDYGMGISFDRNTDSKYDIYLPDSVLRSTIKFLELDIWLGRSVYFRGINSSLYVTGRTNLIEFDRRLEVNRDLNPAFHNAMSGLLGIGLYREKFYSTTLLHGYGYKEYLGAGYRFEIVGGFTWGEFRNNTYIGINSRKGGFSFMGYLLGDLSLGTYIDSRTGKLWRSVADAEIHWFSNLFIVGSSRVRQFLTLKYTHGWNRSEGANELLRLSPTNGPRSLNEYFNGVNRMVINTESVFFTRFQPIGFRVALYGFADIALLGMNANPFTNPLHASLGFGIRVRNERLVFNTIQLQFGIAFGKHGFYHSDYVRLSTEQRVNQYRFIPQKPDYFRYE